MLQASVEKARAFSQQHGTRHALQGTVAVGEEEVTKSSWV